ncbi:MULTISPECIES: hypothetical protein [unclassified Vibrio]|uniref:hypothetical protein n=2 Tax=Vibrio TaxID=662 RepID=UPI00148312F8|nr:MULTISPECIES: hypothetical protein [unclassified Vibrio]NNN39542.1 hypothetical protein [Vibrio sp. 2-2(2)]NNO02085.1 hypothetical protein [Vibrio sp. 7-5(1-a)]
MTGSVKPLPTGSTDKKVEHIADYLERAMAEVALAGNAPDNLLRNPSFAEYYSATLSNDILYGHAVDKAKSFNFMKGIAKPICPSWSIEVQHGGSISYCKVKSGRYSKADLHQNKDGNAVMFGGLGMTGNGANAVLFQEFDTPTLIEDGEQNYYAYVRCCQAGGPQKIRFGICDLDGDGNATSIRASRTIELPAGLYDVKEFWLEIPSLAEGGATINYRKRAFFIESAARGVLSVEGAGVYYGKAGQVPKLNYTNQGIGKEFIITKKFSKADPTFFLPCVEGCYPIDKHLSFIIMGNQGFEFEFQARDTDFSLGDDGTVTMSNIGMVSSTANAQVRGFFSQNLYMNFFDVAPPLV